MKIDISGRLASRTIFLLVTEKWINNDEKVSNILRCEFKTMANYRRFGKLGLMERDNEAQK